MESDEPKRERGKPMEYYIASLLQLLRYIRIYPAERFTLCATFLSTTGTSILLAMNILLLFSETVVLMTNTNLRIFANIIGVAFMHAGGLIKWCYCMKRKDKIVDIMMRLEKYCHVLCQRIDESEKARRMYEDELERTSRNAKFFLYWWMFYCLYGTLHWCLHPLLVDYLIQKQANLVNHTFVVKRNLPFVTWYPRWIDTDDNYVCLYVMQTIGVISSAIGLVFYDVFYLTILMMVCAQLQYINATLARTECHNTLEVTFALERKLRNCVDCHVGIIEFLKVLQTFNGPPMFLQCMSTLVVVCLISFESTTIEITNNPISILRVWSLVQYMLFSGFQTYIFCSYATRLQHLAMQIAYSVYFYGWEFMIFEKGFQPNFNERKNGSRCHDIKRLVQMIILQAQKPIILSGGFLYVLSLDTFKAIITAAISNSIMLRTLSKESSNE